MSASEIKEFLDNLTSHVTFTFNQKICGVDPLSHDHFDMWYGDQMITAKSIDEVMETPFFNGAALTDIIEDMEDIDM